MSSRTEIRVAIAESRATIAFVTEGGLNVLSRDVLTRLGQAVETVAASPHVRFTVVRAEGKVFIAGADIKEMSAFDAAHAREFSIFGNRVLDALEALPSVTIAAIHGAAMGGGCEVALACDFRIAVEGVKIGLPEATLGLIPGWGGTQRSLRLLGPSRARRLVFGGVPVVAAEALKLGLVDQVVADAAALDPAIEELARSLARGAPGAIALAKRAFRTGDEPSAFASCFESPQSREGMSAFLEKRPAPWMEKT